MFWLGGWLLPLSWVGYNRIAPSGRGIGFVIFEWVFEGGDREGNCGGVGGEWGELGGGFWMKGVGLKDFGF